MRWHASGLLHVVLKHVHAGLSMPACACARVGAGMWRAAAASPAQHPCPPCMHRAGRCQRRSRPGGTPAGEPGWQGARHQVPRAGGTGRLPAGEQCPSLQWIRPRLGDRRSIAHHDGQDWYVAGGCCVSELLCV
eukprot:354861-Chlamydomonas_euryale.AAC.21